MFDVPNIILINQEIASVGKEVILSDLDKSLENINNQSIKNEAEQEIARKLKIESIKSF